MRYQKIFENKEFIIVNKPAGLLSHALHNKIEDSLAEQLIKDYPELRKVGEDPMRPGIVHRLDRQASGLMIIPRNYESFENIKEQFKKRTIEKHYLALVYGKISKDYDTIDFPIMRANKGGKMASLPKTYKGEKNSAGKTAITLFDVVKRYINYTLVDVQIKTGRTHQVRTHLSAYGHPIVGDDIYGTKKTKIKNKKLNLGRIFLVAHKLSFQDLKKQKQSFFIDLPPELKQLLKQIK